MEIAIYSMGFSLGLFVVGALVILMRHLQIKASENLAKEIVDEAKEKAEELFENAKREAQAFSEESAEDFEKIKVPADERIELLKRNIAEQEEFFNQKYKVIFDRNHRFNKKVEFYQKEFEQKKLDYDRNHLQLVDLQNKYTISLINKAEVKKEKVLKELVEKVVQENKIKLNKQFQQNESELQHDVEKKARRIICSVLNRFNRAYCPERGINNINFSNEKTMKKVSGPENCNISILEKLIGVDLSLHEDRLFLNVSAFDPVRRELTRLIVEKLMKERQVNEKVIQEVARSKKRELFKKIRRDGNALAKELNIKNFHPEIRNMLGSLRYRYSFSQNQFFHVSEVGWLCGLLSAELNLDVQSGRRAGVLHDIGKAMDHSIDGGHAVIGADFINKHGEESSIVHAVRAHHFDEQPSTELAYLVIAADAISGARPGARRSTAESYTQKMGDLQRIGDSYSEVTNTYILSAGREIRLLVNSQKVSDLKALELSKKVAKNIEENLAFPGQIRVTVVRETNAVQYAK